jgi:L-threonylcarbamoyladenylate synthase
MSTADRIREPTVRAIAEAARHLRDGALVAFPTETVYGLGADASRDEAVARVFAAKARPQFNPLIVHVIDIGAAKRLAHFNERAFALAQRFWPGSLTLVLPRRANAPMSHLATAGLDTIALRVPAHDVALALLKAFGGPLVAPSANPSGQVSPTIAAHVAADLGDAAAMILDGGPCRIGIESTIVGFESHRAVILRHGAIAGAEIEAIAGPLAPPRPNHVQPSAPGQLPSHYAPRAALRLNATHAKPYEALLAFGPHPLAGGRTTLNLSPHGDVVEAAANLFRMLRELDGMGVSHIAVMPIPDNGLGEAINDRLKRAAAPRDASP